MPDWSASMQQTFEYYVVDPGTWKDKQLLDNVISCSINRDSEAETLGSATIDITESVGECYIRAYLITIQNGVKERYPLGTFLVQTPSSSFDGMIRDVSMDAYTPLLELKEGLPPIGYYIAKKENIMETAHRVVREHVRAPVVEATCPKKLFYDFVANTDDTWLSFVIDLIANARYELGLGERGDILFLPKQDLASLQPVWTYDDSNSSILYPELTMDHDLYGIPNVVEVIYSYGSDCKQAVAKNEDPNSLVSIQNRGREIVHRVTDPSLAGYVTQDQIQDYAERVLKDLSTIEYTISYTHAYCPVRVGDCVRLNYTRAGIKGVKAKVISQSISCKPGCPVSEKAVFTSKLWR